MMIKETIFYEARELIMKKYDKSLCYKGDYC